MIAFIAVCVGILTLVNIAMLIVMAKALNDVRYASRALESLAYKTHGIADGTQWAVNKITDFARRAHLGWSIVPVILGASLAAWPRRRGAQKSAASSNGH